MLFGIFTVFGPGTPPDLIAAAAREADAPEDTTPGERRAAMRPKRSASSAG